jgi:hypothetical protein
VTTKIEEILQRINYTWAQESSEIFETTGQNLNIQFKLDNESKILIDEFVNKNSDICQKNDENQEIAIKLFNNTLTTLKHRYKNNTDLQAQLEEEITSFVNT